MKTTFLIALSTLLLSCATGPSDCEEQCEEYEHRVAIQHDLLQSGSLTYEDYIRRRADIRNDYADCGCED